MHVVPPEDASVSVTLPAGQFAHTSVPLSYDPGGQDIHVTCPELGWTCPDRQSVQTVAEEECFPLAQGVHVLLFWDDEMFPEEQGEQIKSWDNVPTDNTYIPGTQNASVHAWQLC